MLWKVYRNLQEHKLLYFLLMLQLILGLVFIVIAQNAYATASIRFADLKKRYPSNEYILTYRQTAGNRVDFLIPTEMQVVADSFAGKAQINYFGLFYMQPFVDGDFQDITFLITSDSISGNTESSDNEVVIIDRQEYDRVQSFISRVPSVKLTPDYLGIKEQKWALQVRELDDRMIDFSLYEVSRDTVPNQFQIRETIVMPTSAYDALVLMTKEDPLHVGMMQITDMIHIALLNDENVETVNQIQESVNDLGRGFYDVLSVLSEAEHDILFSQQLVNQYGAYAAVGLIATTIGSASILWIQWKRRKRDIAICFALGSTLLQQWLEIVLEMGMVIGMSVVLANVFAIPLNRIGNTSMILSKWHFSSVMVSLFIGFSILAISSFVILFPIQKMDPVRIITEEAS